MPRYCGDADVAGDLKRKYFAPVVPTGAVDKVNQLYVPLYVLELASRIFDLVVLLPVELEAKPTM